MTWGFAAICATSLGILTALRLRGTRLRWQLGSCLLAGGATTAFVTQLIPPRLLPPYGLLWILAVAVSGGAPLCIWLLEVAEHALRARGRQFVAQR